MLKPVLEVYIVWHPFDTAGAAIAKEVAEHFHGGAYASLLGGALEVYMRCAGWTAEGAAPRPILWPDASVEEAVGIEPAEFVAIVPLVGTSLNRAVVRNPEWTGYFESIQEKAKAGEDHVRVFPVRINGIAAESALSGLLPANVQYAGEQDAHATRREPDNQVRCRDLAQFMAQWISPQDRDQLQVFISHTKRLGTPEEPVATLVNDVREAFNTGRVDAFYDAHDLKPGDNWDEALRRNAATSALVALRTDLYATREWCQREMLLAKTHGMPVVVLDALTAGESRGSFLMDHTPRIPVRRDADGHFSAAAIRRAINLLADAWLQRALWKRLATQAKRLPQLADYWWAPQAPEPCTLTSWLRAQPGAGDLPGDIDPSIHGSDSAPCIPPLPKGSPVQILHPDPPLSQDERRVLQQMVSLAGLGALDLTTPRLLAARGA
jgi:hypothetical protein